MLDINGDMLEVGRDRARERGLDAKLDFVQANAESLPSPTPISTPTPSPSASATCRASRSRWRRPFAC